MVSSQTIYDIKQSRSKFLEYASTALLATSKLPPSSHSLTNDYHHLLPSQNTTSPNTNHHRTQKREKRFVCLGYCLFQRKYRMGIRVTL